MDYLEIINDLLERYPKYKNDVEIKIKGGETPDELRRKYLRLQDAIRTNAKPWIDPKDRVYENDDIYNKNTMNTRAKELINRLVQEEISLLEKKKKDELPPVEDIEIDEPIDDEASLDIDIAPAEEAPIADMGGDMNMDMSGGDASEKAIGQGLQMALDAAKQLPDGETKDKLIRQIGNTALFFLKTQIPTSGQA
jgi:hypothetical protein